MKKHWLMRFFFKSIFTLLPCFILAQYTGAKEDGMGGVLSTNTSVFTAAHSPAAAGFNKASQIGINLQNNGSFRDLFTGTFAAIHCSSKGAFSYTIHSFGYRNYRETSLGIGYANRLTQNWSVGLRLNSHLIQIPSYGKKQVVSFDLGTIYQISKQVQLAVTARNPIKHRLEKQFNSSRNSSIIIGGNFQANNKICIAWDLKKTLQQAMRFHCGINYNIHTILELRTGVSMKPYALHGGLGLNWQQCQLSLSSVWQSTIGFSSQLSISYAFKSKQSSEVE